MKITGETYVITEREDSSREKYLRNKEKEYNDTVKRLERKIDSLLQENKTLHPLGMKGMYQCNAMKIKELRENIHHIEHKLRVLYDPYNE